MWSAHFAVPRYHKPSLKGLCRPAKEDATRNGHHWRGAVIKIMAVSSRVKHWINSWLAVVNLRIETRTAERAEIHRLLNLDRAGHFRDQVVPILPQIANCDPGPLLKDRKSTRLNYSH